MTLTQDQAADWVRRSAHVRVFSAALGCSDHLMAEGRVIAWCDAPSFTIEHPDGTRSSWSAALPIAEIEAPTAVAIQPDEPEDGSYVAVMDGCFPDLYQRDDDFGPRHSGRGNFARWIPQHGDGEIATWGELTQLGPVAYVGAFVDRSGKEAA